jgi:menaquinone-dependent protoporphyrinogen oxidase
MRWEVASMSRILVLYATKHGSTQQVAEAIAAVAQASGAEVQVSPLGSFRQPVAGWDLVVIGAPIYNGNWHRDAHRFLRRHQDELASLPVAVFGMGPLRDDEASWQRSRAQLDRELAKRAWLVPVAVGLFGGVARARRNRPEGTDLRDWAEIGTWARKVFALVDRSG